MNTDEQHAEDWSNTKKYNEEMLRSTGDRKYKHRNHPCRKPNGGMFLIAKKLFKIDLEKSWMVGDKINDLIAANSKGLKKCFLVLTGYGKEEKENLLTKNFFSVKILPSLKNLKITF